MKTGLDPHFPSRGSPIAFRLSSVDDPNLPGEMQVTIVLKKVMVGTELSIVQEGVPDIIPPETCYPGRLEKAGLVGCEGVAAWSASAAGKEWKNASRS